MSEKMTRIQTPTGDYGFQDWGEKTREHMVKLIRGRADFMRKEAAAIDATADADFEVDIVRGTHVVRHIRSVP